MRDEEYLLKNMDLLPQMRYLFNNKEIFDLTIMVLLAGIKIINQTFVEKGKMRQQFRNLLE